LVVHFPLLVPKRPVQCDTLPGSFDCTQYEWVGCNFLQRLEGVR
jgi:hypothetical protein